MADIKAASFGPARIVDCPDRRGRGASLVNLKPGDARGLVMPYGLAQKSVGQKGAVGMHTASESR